MKQDLLQNVILSLVVTALVITGLALWSTSDLLTAKTAKSVTTEENQEMTMGIVRPNHRGRWFVDDGRYHNEINLKRARTYRKYIKVYYDQPYKSITGFAVTGDEQLALKDISVGSSTRLGYAKIWFTRNGNIVNPRSIRKVGGAKPNINIVIWGER